MSLFFIVTRKASDNEKKPFNIKLMNQNMNGLKYIKLILLKNLSNSKIYYTHYIYQVDFDKDKLSIKDMVSLRLQINYGRAFKINIDVNKKDKRNYFLYDFDDYDKYKKLNLSEIYLSKYEQFNLFKDAISSRGFITENADKDFLIDSMAQLIDKDNIFSLELLLEILDFYYKKKKENFWLNI